MSEREYAPRSGGRTAEQRSSTSAGARRYETRGFRTQGTAALKAEAAQPLRGSGASRAQRAAGAQRDTAPTPRLRVAPPAPISAPRAPFIAVVIAIVVAGVIGILLINTKTNENTFEISKLQDRKTALDNQQQDLENQLAADSSTGNLDAQARKLGLVKAGSRAYIRLPDGRIIGVPKPGEGPTSVTADPKGSASAAPDGDAQNGVTPAGTGQPGLDNNAGLNNGTTQNGTTQNGTTQNGTTQGGAAQGGGTTPGDAAQGGNAQGGNGQGSTTGGAAGQNAGTQSNG